MIASQDRGLLSTYDRDELLRLHYQMLLIRRFEEKTQEMYTRAKIGGYCHLNIGEEAAVVGSISALDPTTYIFTYYREHGHALARGMDPKVVMAELFGKATGCSKGRGGSMHLFDPNLRFMGGYAIVGGQFPLATGVAFASKYRGTGDIVVNFIGEGATNIGSFNECMNLIQLWRLPVVIICVNNQYEMGTPVSQASAVKEIWRKASAYDMASEQVDGMDILAVREAVARAVAKTKEEGQPTFIEAVTYRFRGHSVIDPARYRTPEEVQYWMSRDPIEAFQKRLAEAGLMTETDMSEAEAAVAKAVDEAVAFAESSPDPDPAELYKYVYV